MYIYIYTYLYTSLSIYIDRERDPPEHGQENNNPMMTCGAKHRIGRCDRLWHFPRQPPKNLRTGPSRGGVISCSCPYLE